MLIIYLSSVWSLLLLWRPWKKCAYHIFRECCSPLSCNCFRRQECSLAVLRSLNSSVDVSSWNSTTVWDWCAGWTAGEHTPKGGGDQERSIKRDIIVIHIWGYLMEFFQLHLEQHANLFHALGLVAIIVLILLVHERLGRVLPLHGCNITFFFADCNICKYRFDAWHWRSNLTSLAFDVQASFIFLCNFIVVSILELALFIAHLLMTSLFRKVLILLTVVEFFWIWTLFFCNSPRKRFHNLKDMKVLSDREWPYLFVWNVDVDHASSK